MSMSDVCLGQSFQREPQRRAALRSFARIVTAVVLAAPGFVLAAATPLHLQDRAFMTYAIEQDLAQIAFGEMAMERAADPQVKRFAEKTVTYHRGSAERLRAAAARLDVKPPAALNPVVLRTEQTLKNLTGTAFDQAFLTSTIIANLNGMYSARREMDHGFDADLRAEGARQATDLRTNRREAEQLGRRLEGPAQAGRLTAEDRNFLLYAMHIDMAQRGFAEVAAERATDPRVSALARDLVKYHSDSYDRLAQLAASKGVEPLREVSSISTGTRERLSGMESGPMLDWAFLNAHAFTSYGAHYRYERESIAGGDAQVKAIAGQGARDSRRQHWRSLRIMNDWRWSS
jgi:putative membrane protein